MKKRSRAGGEASKARGREALKTKRRAASATLSSSTIQDTEVARLTRELNEALEQQAATSEVLGIISASPGKLERVFQSILENATRICEAKFGTLFRFDGTVLQPVAQVGTPLALIEAQRRLGPPAPNGVLDVAMKTKRTAHEHDLVATQSYAERNPRMVEAVELGGIRTVVAVPMLKEDDLIGVIAIHRPRSSSFHRQADRVGQELRGPSGYRYRERAAAQRTASAHRRPHGSLGAANSDVRSAPSHQQFSG
jgi:two-component system, NtrC family, sensor kinase